MKAGVFNMNQHVTLVISDQRQIWKVLELLVFFKRSLENYGLRYLNYYGDGDSKSFQSVENVYEGAKVVRYECIWHYQKRVGNRLRKLRFDGKAKAKKEDKVQKKDEGKVKKTKEKAKSRLTDALIDRLQNYFGIALRINVKTVSE